MRECAYLELQQWMAIFQYEIIVFQGQFSIISAFSIGIRNKLAFTLQFAVQLLFIDSGMRTTLTTTVTRMLVARFTSYSTSAAAPSSEKPPGESAAGVLKWMKYAALESAK